MKRLIAPLIATSLLASLVLVFPDGQAAGKLSSGIVVGDERV